MCCHLHIVSVSKSPNHYFDSCWLTLNPELKAVCRKEKGSLVYVVWELRLLKIVMFLSVLNLKGYLSLSTPVMSCIEKMRVVGNMDKCFPILTYLRLTMISPRRVC
jgi:hypothetical protein